MTNLQERRPGHATASIVLKIAVGLIFTFELLPILVAVMSSFSTTRYIKFPPVGFTLEWYIVALTRPDWVDSVLLSLKTAASAVAFTLILGLPFSYGIIRHRFRGSDWLDMLMLSPIIIPEIIIAVSLYTLLYGVFGISGSFPLLVLGHTIAALPYTIRAISANIYSIDEGLEEAASSLGAGKITVFFRIVVPLAKPGIIAGALFAFITSLELFMISLFLQPPGSITLPLQILENVQHRQDTSIVALASTIFFIMMPTVYLIERLVGFETLFGMERKEKR